MIESDNESEVAIWYDAIEHVDPIKSCSESIRDMINVLCGKTKVVCGNIDYKILMPGDDRVPSVPRWLEKINGAIPKLLLATFTTSVVSYVHQETTDIIGDLDKKDVARLRVITKRAYHKSYPHDASLTDHECDQIIDKLGLEIVMEQLRSSVVH